MLHLPIIKSLKAEMLKESKDHYFTGETDLAITMEALNKKIYRLSPSLLNTFETECKVFQSNGLLVIDGNLIRIPDWDLFITQLDSFAMIIGVFQEKK